MEQTAKSLPKLSSSSTSNQVDIRGVASVAGAHLRIEPLTGSRYPSKHSSLQRDKPQVVFLAPGKRERVTLYDIEPVQW